MIQTSEAPQPPPILCIPEDSSLYCEWTTHALPTGSLGHKQDHGPFWFNNQTEHSRYQLLSCRVGAAG